MKYWILLIMLFVSLACARHVSEQPISTESLLNEMVDFERLTRLPEQEYKTIQYSSYDRRSTKPTDSNWFANEDGFGNEPIPGFEEVLKQPDAGGTGEYLICDIQKPGVILRLWTAGISGKIRLFLDSNDLPVYEGNAEDFFWKTVEKLSGKEIGFDYSETYRQFDAVYFPVPFSKGCRIEWIGNIKELHFYHVGVRIYDSNVTVRTFGAGDIDRYAEKLEEINRILKNPEDNRGYKNLEIQNEEVKIPAGSKIGLFNIKGQQAIEYLSLRIKANDYETVLRRSVLSIYFDNSSVPQVQAPVGDFFGAAPGINPYQSLPFSVQSDGTMICRFLMPFRHAAHIEINNNSGETISISAGIRTIDCNWVEGKTMHFRTRWRVDHGLTASNINTSDNDVSDILYLMAMGRGRVVGTAAYIYNPSDVPTSWGNWWGEGDEKIYVERDTLPSFFGTGSEDYFNYSWSSSKVFSYAYCGQPRNDGPGNRGYVSNFRWHIFDDIPFKEKLAFFMELGHHGTVPGFSYGRIVYFYASPGLIDNYQEISEDDIRDIPYQTWTPEAYCGSAGFRFIQAERLIPAAPSLIIEKGKIWAEDTILIWTPVNMGEMIKFQVSKDSTIEKTIIGFTLAHWPDGGIISVLVNGQYVKIDGKETISLSDPDHRILENHFTESIKLNKGKNEIAFKSMDTEKGKKTGIDFVWFKEP